MCQLVHLTFTLLSILTLSLDFSFSTCMAGMSELVGKFNNRQRPTNNRGKDYKRNGLSFRRKQTFCRPLKNLPSKLSSRLFNRLSFRRHRSTLLSSKASLNCKLYYCIAMRSAHTICKLWLDSI